MAQSPRLLIVDDDRSGAQLLGRLLREDGFEAEVALDGATALERLAREPRFDAVITDFHVPGADGLVIAARARKSRARLPIFIVTGDPDGVTTTSLQAPIEVVAKPIDYARLVVRLRAAVALASWPAHELRT